MFFLTSNMNGALLFRIFFCELCYIITGQHFLTSDNLISVVDTVRLECHKIAHRGTLELANVCVRQDSCLGIKTTIGWGGLGMICFCPRESVWPEVTNVTFSSILYLRITGTHLPGKDLTGSWGYMFQKRILRAEAPKKRFRRPKIGIWQENSHMECNLCNWFNSLDPERFQWNLRKIIWWLSYLKRNCPQMNITGPYWW